MLMYPIHTHSSYAMKSYPTNLIRHLTFPCTMLYDEEEWVKSQAANFSLFSPKLSAMKAAFNLKESVAVCV